MSDTCTYAHSGVSCDAPATHAVLHDYGARQCRVVTERGLPTGKPGQYGVEFCEMHGEVVCAARDKHMQGAKLG